MLTTNETTIDFGAIRFNTPYKKDIAVKNIGPNTITPYLDKGGCTCIQVSISQHTITPGNTAIFHIVFTPNTTGELMRTPSISWSENGITNHLKFIVKGKSS